MKTCCLCWEWVERHIHPPPAPPLFHIISSSPTPNGLPLHPKGTGQAERAACIPKFVKYFHFHSTPTSTSSTTPPRLHLSTTPNAPPVPTTASLKKEEKVQQPGAVPSISKPILLHRAGVGGSTLASSSARLGSLSDRLERVKLGRKRRRRECCCCCWRRDNQKSVFLCICDAIIIFSADRKEERER